MAQSVVGAGRKSCRRDQFNIGRAGARKAPPQLLGNAAGARERGAQVDIGASRVYYTPRRYFVGADPSPPESPTSLIPWRLVPTLDPDNLSLAVAFGAGIISFLSPCVLPLVPAYVGHLAGSSMAPGFGSRRLVALVHASAFVLGFSIVFVGFWASIGLIGFVLPGYAGLLRQAGGVALIAVGLHQVGIWRIPLLFRQFRFEPKLTSTATPISSLLVGVAFAAGWTPCIGPVLAGIIGLASMSDTVAEGAYLLVAYSLGLGLPFLATALAISRAEALLKRLKRHFGLVSLVSGVMLVAIGLLMLSDNFKLIPGYFNFVGV